MKVKLLSEQDYVDVFTKLFHFKEVDLDTEKCGQVIVIVKGWKGLTDKQHELLVNNKSAGLKVIVKIKTPFIPITIQKLTI